MTPNLDNLDINNWSTKTEEEKQVVLKRMTEYGQKIKEAEALLFQSRPDKCEIQYTEFGSWTTYATTRDMPQALEIQTFLSQKGYTTRIIKTKTITQFGEELPPTNQTEVTKLEQNWRKGMDILSKQYL